MRIFFSTATENYINKNRSVGEIYELIVKAGHTQTNLYANSYFQKKKLLDKQKTIDRIKKSLKKSDLLIAEISTPSFGVGNNICLAQLYKIPIICLCHESFDKNIPTFLRETDSKSLKLVIYNDTNLVELVENTIKKTVVKKKRFNFNLDYNIYKYLTVISKETGKTKTELIHEILNNKINS